MRNPDRFLKPIRIFFAIDFTFFLIFTFNFKTNFTMKKLFLLVAFFGISFFVKAQTWHEVASATDSLKAYYEITSVYTDATGNVYAAGGFANNNGYQYLAKWNGTVWSEVGGLNGLAANLTIWSVCTDPSINIYVAGLFTNSSGKSYVAKYNGTTWSELGGLNGLAANGTIQSICSDASGNIYAAGYFTNSSGNQYVAKYGNATGINSTCCTATTLTLQPNPTATSTTLTFNNELNNATIEVMNVTGQIIFKKENQSGKQINLDLSNQAAGIYFIQVKQAAEVWRGKVVKE